MTDAEKLCPHCGNTFPLATGYHACKGRPDGHQPWCKSCMCAASIANTKQRRAEWKRQREFARASFRGIANILKAL